MLYEIGEGTQRIHTNSLRQGLPFCVYQPAAPADLQRFLRGKQTLGLAAESAMRALPAIRASLEPCTLGAEE